MGTDLKKRKTDNFFRLENNAHPTPAPRAYLMLSVS